MVAFISNQVVRIGLTVENEELRKELKRIIESRYCCDEVTVIDRIEDCDFVLIAGYPQGDSEAEEDFTLGLVFMDQRPTAEPYPEERIDRIADVAGEVCELIGPCEAVEDE